jgi:hypothetical protein
MELSTKAKRYIIEALEFYEKHHERLLKDPQLSEDEIADLHNDQRFLAAIRQSLQQSDKREPSATQQNEAVA